MDTTTNIKANILYFEGYSYVEFNGEYFKGCKRCGGTGHYMFDGFDSLCYLCRNTDAKLGDAFANEAEAQKWCHGRAVRKAQADRKREAVRLAKLAKRDAAWQALKDQHPTVWDLLSSIHGLAIPFQDSMYNQDVTERDSFVLSMTDKLWKLDEVGFSPRQLEVLTDIAAKRVARQEEAAAHPVPAGRQVVTGEIVSAKVVEGDYGTAYKITVKDDRGFRIYCSLPKAQADEVITEFESDPSHCDDEGNFRYYTYGPACWFLGTQGTDEQGVKGRRITFTATLEQSRDDASFGFGSRPTKGAWL
jgi:hypothetical protein